MKRYVVIVEPLSSGNALAAAFKKYSIEAIAITLSEKKWTGYGNQLKTEEFAAIIPYQNHLAAILQDYHPIAIIPGTEEAVIVAEQLTQQLLPHLANESSKALHRLHKAKMQEALEAAQLPYLKTLNTNSITEADLWLEQQGLKQHGFILKPPMSAGSDKVFTIPAKADWQYAFQRILNEPNKITGAANTSVVLQELAIGTEFAIGTVSANASHYLSHIIQYNKQIIGNQQIIYDYVEFIDYATDHHAKLVNYANKVLDALGIRWGAAHIEIILTDRGPRLIEVGARMCGGPVVNFSRAATGSSQADKLAELYTLGTLKQATYQLQQTVIAVFLKSNTTGTVTNLDIFDACQSLPTFMSKYLWYANFACIPKTTDYLTSLGIIALIGNKNNIMADYTTIRSLESQLNIAVNIEEINHHLQ